MTTTDRTEFKLDPARYEGHTPGPWIHRDLIGFPIQIATAPDDAGFGFPVADINARNAEPNARLIADAPAILARAEALEAALREIMDHADGNSELGQARHQIRIDRIYSVAQNALHTALGVSK